VDALAALVHGYRPRDDIETGDVARLRRLVDDGDPWSRDGALHVTASALVVDPRRRLVLLRWHARMQRWLQVGGHADPGEIDPWEIALREAREETGLDDLAPLSQALARVPVQVVVVDVPAGGDEPAHEHVDIRYVFVTARPEHSRAESPDAAVRWLSFEAARNEISEPNLLEFVARVEALLEDAPLAMPEEEQLDVGTSGATPRTSRWWR
jgi:8-oxo-dGTP pyrophosphatase MutT (NUDIX family)